MEVKYWARVDDRSFEIVLRETEGQTTILVDGREATLQLEEGAPGVYTLLVDGKPYDLAAVQRPGGYLVAVQGVPLEVSVEDDRQRRLSAVGGARAGSAEQILLKAPMPGLVVQTDVAKGDRVEAGQRLIVLEAMKMENDLLAPRAGHISEIRVEKGQVVGQGEVLVIIE